ncbi:uncharacterized protein bbg [Chelonus insularis]|uniref:uncharacterized protein bbg n=1 Tax=Chelonus insularis TaxID=460826 RepID=UPI00158D0C17|nr:uncharacterized protein LOC118072210 [Chelonus insularis]
METMKNGSEEFVTVVSVGNQPKIENFVTVLSIGNGQSGKKDFSNSPNNVDTYLEEEVEVYRLPGERLGFGLKFEGGNKTAERVRRLFVQSCAEHSPASRAKCSWGGLGEGDEILCIDGVPVKHMSRLDCVRKLKESQLVIKLLVRYRGALKPEVVSAERKSATEKKKIPPELPSAPPPVPPRKLRQVRGSADGEANPSPIKKVQQNGNESSMNAQSSLRASNNKPTPRDNYNSSPKSMSNVKNESPRKLSKELSTEAIKLKEPPEAMVYLDARSQDGSSTHGSTSDDTGSSLSTVVDRFSSSDRFSTTSTISTSELPLESPSKERIEDQQAEINQFKETSQELLKSFEQLDRDFCSNPPDYLLKRLANSEAVTHVESRGEAGAVVEKITAVVAPNTVVIEETLTLQPPLSFQDAPLSYGHEARPGIFLTADSSTHFCPIQDDISVVESIIGDSEFDVSDLNTNVRVPPPLPARNHINCISVNQNDDASTQVDVKLLNERTQEMNCETNEPLLPPRPLPRKDTKLKRKRLPPPPPPPTPRRELPPPVPIRNLESKPGESESKKDVTVVEISTNLLQESKESDEIASSKAVSSKKREPIESSSRSFDNNQKQMNGICTNESLIKVDCDKSKSHEIIINNYSGNNELSSSPTTNKVLEIIEMKTVKALKDSTKLQNKNEINEKKSVASSPKVIGHSSVLKDVKTKKCKANESNANDLKLSENNINSNLSKEECNNLINDEKEIGKLVNSFDDDWEEAREYQDNDDIQLKDIKHDRRAEESDSSVDTEDDEVYQSLECILDDKKLSNLNGTINNIRQTEETDSSSDSDDTGNDYYWQSNLATIGEEDEVTSLEYTSVNPEISKIDANSSNKAKQLSDVSTTEETDGINNNDVQDEIERMSRISKDPETTDKITDKNTVNGRMDNCGGGQRLPPDGDEFPAAYQEFSVTSQQYQVLESSRNSTLTSDNESGGYSYKKSTSFQTESRISQYIIPSVKEMTITTTEVVETLPDVERRNLNPTNTYLSNFSNNNNNNNKSNSSSPMLVLTERKIEIADYYTKDSKIEIDTSEKDYVDCPPPPLPLTDPPKMEKPVPLGRSMSTDSSSRKFSLNGDCRRQDDKSEKSVRDKIAMFSSQSNLEAPLFPANPITSIVTNFNRRLSKYKSSEDFFSEEKSCSQKDKSKVFSDRTISSCDLTESSSNNKSDFLYEKYVDRPPVPVRSTPLEEFNNKSTFNLRNVTSNSESTTQKSSNSSFFADIKPVGNGIKTPISSSTLSLSDKKEDGVPVTKTTMSLTRATSFSGGVCSNGELSPINNGQISRANSVASTFKRTSEDMRRTSLNQLIEQRRKSISKLRGLVIPEKDAVLVDKPIIDLPEIKSRDSILVQQMPKVNIQDKWGSQSSLASNISTSSVPVKTTSFKMPTPQILPKYSPAFKRKSLTVCGTTNISSTSSNAPTANSTTSTNPSTPTQQTSPPSTSISTEAPKSLESICSPTRSDYSFEFVPSSSSPENLRSRPRIGQKKPRGDYDDSDNDSAVSSSQSSISRGFSPPASPVPSERSNVSSERSYPMSLITEIPSRNHLLNERSQFMSKPLSYSSEKYGGSNRSFSDSSSGTNSSSRSPPSEYNSRYSAIPQRQTLKRSSSTETNYSTSSTLTSGSQASAESLSKRVLKPQSVEAINRKNILASARCRSGQNLSGSPLIQRKFTDDEEATTFGEKNGKCMYERMNSNENLSNNSNIKVAYVDMIDNYDDIKEIDKSSSIKLPLKSDIITSSNDLKMWVRAEAKALLGKNSNQTNGNDFHSEKDAHSSQIESCSIVNESKSSNGNGYNESVESESIKSIKTQNDDLLATLTTKTRSRAPINFEDEAIFRSKNQMSLEDILTGKIDPQIHHESQFFSGKYQENAYSRDSKISMRSSSKANEFLAEEKTFVSKIPTYGRSKMNESIEENGSITERSRNSKIPLQKPLGRRSASVTDMKKAIDKSDYLVNHYSNNASNQHQRFSSLDSNVEDPRPVNGVNGENDAEKYFGEQFGSISSLASSTSLISQQELAQLVEEASLEDSKGPHEVVVVLLHKDNPTGSVGITLAGGVDCEAKEITVHRVLAHSIADKDGRVQRGDRILSINGKSTRGLSHKESLAILKQPRSEVVMVVSRARIDDGNRIKTRTESVETVVEGLALNGADDTAWGPPTRVVIYKGGAGLGFSLEGGRDSPVGDRPLVIKKIFTGGAAEKTGALTAGDQLLEVNGTDVTRMSRIEAWSLMKKLHNGEVNLLVRHPAIKSS